MQVRLQFLREAMTDKAVMARSAIEKKNNARTWRGREVPLAHGASGPLTVPGMLDASVQKTWSERPQERCNVCDLQYQHHQEFWTNCGKTQGFLAYSACSLDVNLRKNAETTRASNGAFSSNSLLFAVYLHLWSTSALFFLFFSTFLVGSVCITCRGWRRHICIIIDTCQNLYYYKHIPIYTHLYL